MKRFEDKVVVVTGAASGIGETTVREFVKEGAKVVLADLSIEAGEKLRDELNQEGFDTFFVKTDVSNEADVKNLIEKTVEKYGRLDVMFANAGIHIDGDFHNVDLEQWQKIIDIDLTGVFLCNKYAIEQYLAQGDGGVIVNTGSINSYIAFSGLAPYSAAKGGVKMLTQQVTARYAKDGIRANAIAPGTTNTPLVKTLPQEAVDKLVDAYPVGRFGEPEEIARTVLFLASDDASFIHGVTLPVDGGYTAM